MHRNQTRREQLRSSRIRLAVFASASTAAGAAAGAGLAAAGSTLSPDVRAAAAAALALVAAGLSSAQLCGARVRPVQCDRETPRRWVDGHPLAWAMRNGLVLGIGATTRIGFLLWYAVPAGALLSGRPLLGAALYGTYSATRALGALALMLVPRRSSQPLDLRLLGLLPAARRLTAAHLLALAVAAGIAVGL